MAMPSAAKDGYAPVKKTRRDTAGRIKSTDSIPVYCVCQLPEMAGTQYVLN